MIRVTLEATSLETAWLGGLPCATLEIDHECTRWGRSTYLWHLRGPYGMVLDGGRVLAGPRTSRPWQLVHAVLERIARRA